MIRIRFLLPVMLLLALAAALAGLPGLSIRAQEAGDPTPTPSPEPTATASPTPEPTPEPTPTESTDTLPTWPRIVQVSGSDGLPLFGDFYLLDPARPTVVLIHQMYTDRASWGPLVSPLLWSNRNVLAVDVRGHGASVGAVNWHAAVDDVSYWLDWLRGEGGVNPDAITLIGSSMGSSLALVGCALDAQCPTAIGISPGWSYYGVYVEPSFALGFGERPVLLVYAENDMWPAVGVPRIVTAATNPVTVEMVPGQTHGMALFATDGDTLIPLIVAWLDHHGG